VGPSAKGTGAHPPFAPGPLAPVAEPGAVGASGTRSGPRRPAPGASRARFGRASRVRSSPNGGCAVSFPSPRRATPYHSSGRGAR
jgi:hypothetical protein